MFSAFFIRRPKFAIVISLFFMLAGIICVGKLPIAEYPEVSPPTIAVSAFYPGAGAQVIADTVAAPIETEVNGIEGLLYYTSSSDNSGGYALTLTFRSDASSDMALVNVNNAVKRAEHNLPIEVVMNGVSVTKRSSDILGIISFTSDKPEHTPLYLSNYVSNNIRDAVARIEGVGQVLIFGEMKYSMRVWLDPLKMRALEISQEEIMNAISRQNIQAATGAVGTEGSSDAMQFKLETQGRLKEASEFKNIVVRVGDNGRQVRLSDVARVELGAENYVGTPTVNGKTAVMLAVFKLSDANALSVVNQTDALMKKLQNNFPDGIQWALAYDTTAFVRAAMWEIFMTLILTFCLVVLITYLFLQDWRATVIPIIAIPVSIIGTFPFLYAMNMSINTLTMFGLILVIGAVVDDAICVVECCMRLIHEEKLSPFDAAMRAMQELSNALIATCLVVVAIYVPIGFFGGMVGTIYWQFAVTMCVALIISAIVALTLSPALCALVLHDVKEPRGFFRYFNIGLDFTRNRYLNVAGFLTRHSVVTLLVIALFLFGNYVLFRRLPTSFLPAEDKGMLLCEVTLPSGAALPRTQEVLQNFASKVMKMEGVERVIAIPGRSMVSGSGENMGMMFLNLKSWDERTTPETSITAIQAKILKEGASIAEAKVSAFVPPAIMGLGMTGGVTFALQATGDQSMQEISQASNLLVGKIMATRKALYAVSAFDVSTPILDLKIDRDKAEAMDVPVSSVFSTLQSQLGSMYVNDFNLYGKTYKVKIQSEPEFRENLNAIGQLTVASTRGNLVPIDALATVDWTLGPRQVDRFNMFPTAMMRAQTMPGTSSSELMKVIQELVYSELPNDYQISWTDMSYQETQNEGQIVSLMLLAIMFAYMFLVAQYESWSTPVSVMLSVATATFGAMATLIIVKMPLDIYCQLGLLMLIGLTAKTAILMAEYSKQLREDGLSIRDAAIVGMKVRFRAVMMTALAFTFGIFPMVVATGAGAGSRHSIGITTFWGMIAATIVGMALIPGLYAITRSTSEGTKRLFWKEKEEDKK